MSTMLLSPPSSRTLDALLELVCLRVQLTATQDQRARQHYEAVSGWLSCEGSPLQWLGPHIFPQGSQRLGTTAKPISQAEFDLDAVCLFRDYQELHPGAVYRRLWNRLWDNRIYRPMMKTMPRCVRLEYSGDFHLDIAPAVRDLAGGGNRILVPDLDANLPLGAPENDRWKSTNPQDYADWFEDRCVQSVALMEKYARAQVDPVPEQEPVHEKPTLKRSVQLFKRWRDVEYQTRPEHAPPSIILTTLSGHLYRGEMLCSDALDSVLSGIVSHIESGQPICLKNPAHPGEDICEKWQRNSASYRDFVYSVTAFRDRWQRLRTLTGLSRIEEELSELFDEAPVKWAVKEFIERRVVAPRAKKSLGVQRRTGALASAGIGSLPVRQNTFFGN